MKINDKIQEAKERKVDVVEKVFNDVSENTITVTRESIVKTNTPQMNFVQRD